MKWEELLSTVGIEPVFTTGMLLAGQRSRAGVERQLSRWTAAGRVIQMRRGVYTVAPPYRPSLPHPFVLANRIRRPSYVSLQSALSFRGMIPEDVPSVTSVTTGRPETVRTPVGVFLFRHVKRSWFHGYEEVRWGAHSALVATPEKALLDLVHLTAGGDGRDFLDQLRLDGLEGLNLEEMRAAAGGSPKLQRAVRLFARLAAGDRREER